MDYEQKYKDALRRAKKLYGEGTITECLGWVFPELEESEDERIRKDIISYLRNEKIVKKYISDIEVDKWIAWLEKQGEQPADKIEPKFKVGDWLQYRYAEPFLVEEITEQGYCNGNSCLPFEWENEIHLWTIQDAKEGDILAAEPIDNYMSPFVAVYANRGKDFFNSHCFISFDGQFCDEFTAEHSIDGIHPATKEQRDLLFQKMANAGYEWDTEKKELRKIEPKTLNPDRVVEWLKHCNITDCDMRTFIIPRSSPTSIPHRVRWFSDEFIEQFKKDFVL